MAYSSGIKCIFQLDIPPNSEVGVMTGFQPRERQPAIAAACVLKLPEPKRLILKHIHTNRQKPLLSRLMKLICGGNLGMNLRA